MTPCDPFYDLTPTNVPLTLIKTNGAAHSLRLYWHPVKRVFSSVIINWTTERKICVLFLFDFFYMWPVLRTSTIITYKIMKPFHEQTLVELEIVSSGFSNFQGCLIKFVRT